MVEPYRDPWKEYKSALDSLKKKFLKKPNNQQVLAELANLALRFQFDFYSFIGLLRCINISLIHIALQSCFQIIDMKNGVFCIFFGKSVEEFSHLRSSE